MLGLEESRLELESVWSSVNLLNIVTDKLEMDRFAQVNLTQLSAHAWSWRACGALSTFSTLSQTSWRWTGLLR
jgi:hypothetical protein